MKFLEPTITCLLTSHMKPDYLPEALESVLNQTRTDFQLLIIDSGQWINKKDEASLKMYKIYNDFHNHPLIEWVFTGESEAHHKTVCPVAHWTNCAIKAGLIRGKYFCTFYDDDRYYPQFMEKMAGYLDEHPEVKVVWCSERRIEIRPNGQVVETGVIKADRIRSGETFDCAVDGMQVMIRKGVLDLIDYPWLDEDIENCSHSDGVFLNKIGKLGIQFYPIHEILCEHRATPISTYTPTK